MYSYSFNNPINFTDEDGSWPKWLKKAAVAVAVTNTTITAVDHRITTGSWSGSGEKILEAATDGAITGAIAGTVVGATTSSYTAYKAVQTWSAGSGGIKLSSLNRHYQKHVIEEGIPNKNQITYTKDAINFRKNNLNNMIEKTPTDLGHGHIADFKRTKNGGGMYTKEGKIITFWYK